MNIFKMKATGVFVFAAILFIAGHAKVIGQQADERAPELPAGCEHLRPEGQQVAFKVYASGVQVYWWNGTSWGFVGPIATLYADAGLRGKVGTHYGGPTWKSNSGSLVIGARPLKCTPDPNSIQWLLLEADETDGAGIFNGVTYIQRVNTSGGIAPTTPGTIDGEQVSVPYTTEYYFYKKAD
jgi:hypothetical protein